MRTSNRRPILVALLCALSIALFATAEAQILSKLLKKAAKKSIKSAVVEKTTKEIAQDMATKAVGKEFGERIAVRVLRRETAQGAMIKGSKHKAAQAISGEVLQHNADNILLKALGRESAEHTVSRAARATATDMTQRVTSKSICESSQQAVQRAIKQSSAQATRRVALDAGQLSVERQIKDIVGTGANKVLRDKCTKETLEQCSKQLLEDVASNKALAQAIKKNPQLASNYLQAIDAPAVRNDITALRYLNKGADKFVDAGYLKKWGRGEDLIFKQSGDICKIYDRNGDFLGDMIKSADGTTTINCSATNRKLLNLYPMNNTTYTCGKHKWVTDRYGRVKSASYSVDGTETILNRAESKNVTNSVRDLKNRYNSQGRMSSDKMPTLDDGGHLIPRSAGGTNDAINIVPQNAKSNRGGLWKQCENAASSKRAAKIEATINCQIDLNYTDNMTLRPSDLSRTHTINGKAQRLKGGVTIQNCTVNNPLE
jgi:hypothetical protein